MEPTTILAGLCGTLAAAVVLMAKTIVSQARAHTKDRISMLQGQQDLQRTIDRKSRQLTDEVKARSRDAAQFLSALKLRRAASSMPPGSSMPPSSSTKQPR